jgi:hypothetical protein
MRGVHAHVATPGQVGFIPDAIQMGLAESIRVGEARVDFVLYGQRGLQRKRRERVDQHPRRGTRGYSQASVDPAALNLIR